MKPLLAITLLAIAALACSANSVSTAEPASTMTTKVLASPHPSPTMLSPLLLTVTGDWNCRTEPSAEAKKCPEREFYQHGAAVIVYGIRPDGWLIVENGRYICGRAIPSLQVEVCK